MKRFLFPAVIGLLLAGCSHSGRVMETVPPPYVIRSYDGPPAPTGPIDVPPPQPKPVPPPVAHGRIDGAKVVIDPGHGGKDPGTKGVSPVWEKMIVLSVGNELAEMLARRGASVYSTRMTDKFIELDARAAVADRTRADLFVAVHADSAANPSASGATIYISRNASTASYRAASRIVSALNRAGIECRGIHRANYRVLVAHSRPAVLVEIGFLTNSKDARLLNTPDYRTRIANALAQGIADYFAN